MTTQMITGRVWRLGQYSLRWRPRAVLACLGLAAVVFAAFITEITTGDFPISPQDALTTILGLGDTASEFIVLELRLPRALTAVLVGAALGASGCVLQGLARNPLASPDFIGFTEGAATGAICAIVLGDGNMISTAIGSLIGGTVSAIVVFGLSRRRGGAGPRLILVGIGVTAALVSVNSYLITKAALHDALSAKAWLVGGLNNRGWTHVWAVGIGLAVLLPVALFAGRRISLLDFGDPTATALGVRVERARTWLYVSGVGLAAIATASAGPILFLALAAPRLARGLVGGGSVIASALLGSALLVSADVLTQRLFSPTPLPVGVITAGLGGLYLVWLLTTSRR